MELDFFKIQAQGNDYIYFDFLESDLPEISLNIFSQNISHRRFGVGSDGIVLILPSAIASAKMRIFNSDGSEALLCGSALRSIVFYLHQKYPSNQNFTIETNVGIREGQMVDGQSQIKIGKANKLDRNFDMIENYLLRHNISIETIQKIDVGNPHLVIYTDDVNKIDLEKVAPNLEKISDPQEGTNIEFCRVVNTNLIQMKVWERGSGVTYACGTGASASAYSGMFQGFLDEKVSVEQPGGKVLVEMKNNEVFLSGPTKFVFNGTIETDNFI